MILNLNPKIILFLNTMLENKYSRLKIKQVNYFPIIGSAVAVIIVSIKMRWSGSRLLLTKTITVSLVKPL